MVEDAYALGHRPFPAQSEVIGAVEAVDDDRDVVVAAAGSLPGDLHKLWRTRDPKGYHVEYAFSCMGYEIAAGLGVKMADPTREVYVMVGDGSYLMLNSELVDRDPGGHKIIVVLVVNHGFQSIGALSESVGVERFGTKYRYRDAAGQLAGDSCPSTGGQRREPRRERAASGQRRRVPAPGPGAGQHLDDGHARRDRPDGGRAGFRVVVGRAVAEVAQRESTRAALARYGEERAVQRPFLRPTTLPPPSRRDPAVRTGREPVTASPLPPDPDTPADVASRPSRSPARRPPSSSSARSRRSTGPCGDARAPVPPVAAPAGVVLSVHFVGALFGVPLGWLAMRRFTGGAVLSGTLLITSRSARPARR